MHKETIQSYSICLKRTTCLTVKHIYTIRNYIALFQKVSVFFHLLLNSYLYSRLNRTHFHFRSFQGISVAFPLVPKILVFFPVTTYAFLFAFDSKSKCFPSICFKKSLFIPDYNLRIFISVRFKEKVYPFHLLQIIPDSFPVTPPLSK